MRQPGEGRDRDIAGGDVIADLAEDLHRVGVALRRQRLGERRAADAATGVDVVPGIADADRAAQPPAAAIGGVRGEIFAVDLGAIVTSVEAEVRTAGPRRERRCEAVTAEADAGDQPLVVRIHRSAEHTSELQSLMRISYAVHCLKKKTTKDQAPKIQTHKYSSATR